MYIAQFLRAFLILYKYGFICRLVHVGSSASMRYMCVTYLCTITQCWATLCEKDLRAVAMWAELFSMYSRVWNKLHAILNPYQTLT